MIDQDLARNTVALLGTAAAMLMEDSHDQLVTRPLDASEAAALGSALTRLGNDLNALAGAVQVLTRRDA